MNKIDRYKILVRHIIDNGYAPSQKELGKKLGYQNESSFSQILNEKVRQPKDFIERLKSIVPELNEEWIETGKGEMLCSPTIVKEVVGDNNTSIAGNSNNVNNSSTIERAIDEISEMRKLIQQQVKNNQEQFDRFMSVIERLTSK